MVIVVFRSRLRTNADLQALAALGQRMAELADAMPGLVSYKDFAAEDGENLTLVQFDTEAHLQAWAEHPEHRAAQERGRRDFFDDYRIEVCEVKRAYTFDAPLGRRDLGLT